MDELSNEELDMGTLFTTVNILRSLGNSIDISELQNLKDSISNCLLTPSSLKYITSALSNKSSVFSISSKDFLVRAFAALSYNTRISGTN
ncbi:hypothetical protein OGAPHI_005881 [Ogataea philodendri]|uniref:Uncharacterized protein n=1 Tax=Ogataea philodendri TaxID=1378263 RepID=A0A9P8T1Y4_9ASCO|nr:uncharacterized protein OGAPHI_005881 [Ogataea philodendri]KAH3662629.1 hypothetical protein OGAPHI_005881 [Ogataea philodendri]